MHSNVNPMQDSIGDQLDTIFPLIDARVSTLAPQLSLVCQRLHSQAKHVTVWAREYDVEGREANGFWTFARLVLKFGRLCLEVDAREWTTRLLPVAQLLETGLELCQQFHSEQEEDMKKNLFATSEQRFPELLNVFAQMGPQLDVVYGSFCSYWLCQSMRRVMTGFTALMAIYSGPDWWQSSRSLWDRDHRAHTVAFIAQNATVEFVKSFWGLTEYSLVKQTLPAFTRPTKHASEVWVPRQTRFRIEGTRVLDSGQQEMTFDPNSRVRCRLLRSRELSTRELVLHVHGGGFVSQSPDSHEVYLRQWAERLNGTPLLSVDYALSPETKFPTALQQILDVYLWITNAESAETLCGESAAKVVVCGDSAGGNLACALTLVLHEMRQMPLAPPMPKGVVCFYTPFMLQTRASPSRLMTAIDTLLPLGVLLSCLEAYVPNRRPEVKTDENFLFSQLHINQLCEEIIEEDDFEVVSLADVPPRDHLDNQSSESGNDWTQHFQRSLLALKRKLIGSPPTPPLNPWYRADEESLRETLLSLNTSANNGFISPLLAPHLDISDVTLYLVALHFDACLDDSIEMARKWTGPVVLDVLDELPHGFLNFVLLSAEAQRGADLCIDRVRQALS